MTFTEQDFYTEINRFREHFGTKDWWALGEEKHDACIKGLALIYLNINNADGTPPTKDQIERYANVFQNTVAEYEQRKCMLLRFSQKKN